MSCVPQGHLPCQSRCNPAAQLAPQEPSTWSMLHQWLASAPRVLPLVSETLLHELQVCKHGPLSMRQCLPPQQMRPLTGLELMSAASCASLRMCPSSLGNSVDCCMGPCGNATSHWPEYTTGLARLRRWMLLCQE